MKKETLGAALFFCGLGIFFTLLCPIEGWFWWLIISVILMIAGLKIGGYYSKFYKTLQMLCPKEII